MSKSIVIDTGFWFALFDTRNSHHKNAVSYLKYIKPHILVIPWPTLYETLKIDAILTFNRSDFSDICYKKGIELFSI